MFLYSVSQLQAVSNNTRSKKVQNQPKCPGSGADAALPSKSKMGNDQAVGESVPATEPHSISVEERPQTNVSEASLINSPASSTNRCCLPNSVTNNHTSGKKERGKVTPQKQKVLESCKGEKRQGNEGNKTAETTKHRNEIMRKGVRHVGLRSSSRSGNLTVRVAS